MSRRKILIGIGIVLGVAFIPVIRHYQLRAATRAYIAELKAKGEPMELAQVFPPQVPREQNGADIFRSADGMFDWSFHAEGSLLETNFVYGMRMVAPGKAMVRWQQPDIRDIDGTNSWENLTAAVVQNAKAFALLQRIVEKPNFSFPIDYDHGVADLNFTNLHLAESKRSALRLETAALCALHQNDAASAAKSLRAMLAFVKAMRDERLVISELVTKHNGPRARRIGKRLGRFGVYSSRRKRTGNGTRNRRNISCKVAKLQCRTAKLFRSRKKGARVHGGVRRRNYFEQREDGRQNIHVAKLVVLSR